jgi:hypothetical protein
VGRNVHRRWGAASPPTAGPGRRAPTARPRCAPTAEPRCAPTAGLRCAPTAGPRCAASSRKPGRRGRRTRRPLQPGELPVGVFPSCWRPADSTVWLVTAGATDASSPFAVPGRASASGLGPAGPLGSAAPGGGRPEPCAGADPAAALVFSQANAQAIPARDQHYRGRARPPETSCLETRLEEPAELADGLALRATPSTAGDSPRRSSDRGGSPARRPRVVRRLGSVCGAAPYHSALRKVRSGVRPARAQLSAMRDGPADALASPRRCPARGASGSLLSASLESLYRAVG